MIVSLDSVALGPSMFRALLDSLLRSLQSSLRFTLGCSLRCRIRSNIQEVAAGSSRVASVARERAWCYVVWVIPNHPEARGIHVGSGRAWAHLLPLLEGRYRYSAGHRLRKTASLREAVSLYQSEAATHGAPSEPKVFTH